ncbi:MAG: phosphoesterase, partial [Eubacterium sp.]
MKSAIGYAKLYFAIFMLSVVLLYFNIALGILGIMLCGICYFFDRREDKSSNVRLQNAIESIYCDIDKINQERMYELPVSMVVVNKEGEILWYNQYFDCNFRKKDDGYTFFGKNIKDELVFDYEKLIKEKECDYAGGGMDYTVVANSFTDGEEDLLLFHFFDVTVQKKQQEIYKKKEPVFCYVLIDNYDDIIEQLPSHERSALLSQIDLKLNEWAKRLGAFIIEYENDHYLMIFEKEKLKSLEEER